MTTAERVRSLDDALVGRELRGPFVEAFQCLGDGES